MTENTQFPTFLGIGTVKSGSTWLHHLLKSHPEIWMPEKRSEPQFLDRNYNKGKEWYAQFFPQKGLQYKQIGEFTPRYIHSKETLQRARNFGDVEKFIISLRNPVERLYSQYKWTKRNHPKYKASFKEFVAEHPEAVTLGYYANELEKYNSVFGESPLLVLVFEEMVRNVEWTKVQLAEFLEVDAALFPKEAGHQSSNKSFTPKYGGLYTFAIKVGQFVRSRNLYGLEQLLRKTPLMKFVSTPGKALETTKEDLLVKQELYKKYENDINALKKLVNCDLSIWKQQREELQKKITKTQ